MMYIDMCECKLRHIYRIINRFACENIHVILIGYEHVFCHRDKFVEEFCLIKADLSDQK